MSEPSFSLGPLSAIIETYPYKQMIRRLTCFSLGPLSAIIETLTSAENIEKVKVSV